jgi:hypothetical protein
MQFSEVPFSRKNPSKPDIRQYLQHVPRLLALRAFATYPLEGKHTHGMYHKDLFRVKWKLTQNILP